VRLRIGLVSRLLREQRPDVLCLQETKCPDASFPIKAFRRAGYEHIVLNGQKGYHGVAIASRHPLHSVERRSFCGKGDSRHVAASLDYGGRPIAIHNFYVPAGGDEPDPEVNPKLHHKLSFLDELHGCMAALAVPSAILVGDLNVAPLETDVWNHKKLLRNVGHTPLESDLMAKLLKAGKLTDLPRRFVPPDRPLYTWWGYRFPQSVERDYGWRLDHILASESVAREASAARVVRDTRLWDKPSDHVPVILDIG
jgi:exodeoxyribonuclease-3